MHRNYDGDDIVLPGDPTKVIRAAENPDLVAIKAEAVKSGMRYIYEDGLRQVIEGITSINELLRVCK